MSLFQQCALKLIRLGMRQGAIMLRMALLVFAKNLVGTSLSGNEV